MKLITAVLLLGVAAPAPELRYFRYERSIEIPPQASGQTCVVLSPAIFSHAATQLTDLRLYRGNIRNALRNSEIRSSCTLSGDHCTFESGSPRRPNRL